MASATWWDKAWLLFLLFGNGILLMSGNNGYFTLRVLNEM
jgi:hypothetical protein